MRKYFLIIILSVLFLLFLIYLNNRSSQEIFNHKVIFSEVSKEAGLYYIQNNINFSNLTYNSYLTSDLQSLFSGGVAYGDFNNDGYEDLYVSVLNGIDKLFKNNKDGTFNEVSKEIGLNLNISSNGVIFVDVNNDGWDDLFISTINEERNYLFVNYKGRFEEEGFQRGIFTEEIEYGFWPSFGDFDNDGWMDISTTHWDRGSVRGLRNDNYGRLFHNKGDGYFEDVTDEKKVRMRTSQSFSDVSFESKIVDLDNDNLKDLIVAADFGNSKLYWNNGNHFIDGTSDSGVGLDEFGMGIAVGDYNNDGLNDFFISSIYCKDNDCMKDMSGNKLYKNLGNRKFEEVSEIVNLEDGGWGWNAEFFDYDNDKDLDLLMSRGMRKKIMGEHNFTDSALKLWRNDNGYFVDVTSESKLNLIGDGRDLVVFDYDNDKDLDIFVVRNGDSGLLFRNELY